MNHRFTHFSFVIIGLFLLDSSFSKAQSWTQVSKIVAADRAVGDRFAAGGAGSAYSNGVSVSGNYAIVGAYMQDFDAGGANNISAAGAAYVYERNGAGNWVQVQKLIAPVTDRDAGDFYGVSVSISGDYAVVSSSNESKDAFGLNVKGGAGAVYIYERNGSGTWVLAQKIVPSDRTTLDYFGTSVCISGDHLIVGAYWEGEDASGGNTLSKAGSSYVFERNGVGTWVQVQKIVASDRAIDDNFGVRVSISGDYAVVATWQESEDASGGNTMLNAGSAYVFERNGAGTWIQVQKIVASDRNTNDYFGFAVSLSGSYLVVGAKGEDEDSLGTNTMLDAGSAYVFERNGSGTWVQVKKLVASDRTSTNSFGYSVGVSGNNIVVGAPYNTQDVLGANTKNWAGASYVFNRDGSGNWLNVQKIVNADRDVDDQFGSGSGISGNYIIVAAPVESEDASGGNTMASAGSAYIFSSSACNLFLNTTQKNVDCNGNSTGSVSVTAFGGATPYTYNWNNNQTTNTISNLSAGIYTVLVTDASSCTVTTTINITQPNAISLSIGTNCYDIGFVASLSGGTTPYTYLWSNSTTSATATGLSPHTSYTLLVTDANGCTKKTSLTTYSLIVANFIVSNTSCSGGNTGSILGSAHGGNGAPYYYKWNSGNVSTTSSISGLSAGIYTVNVYDFIAASTCYKTYTLQVVSATSATTSIGYTNMICYGALNGIASASTVGGSGPFTYNWSNNQTTSTISNLSSGTYTLVITDNIGCSETKTFTILESTSIDLITTSATVNCGQTNGIISTTVSGGTPGYSYLWSNGKTTDIITGLGAGNYTLLVTDLNGCSKQTSASIINAINSGTVVVTIVDSIQCNGDNNGVISGSMIGGNPSYHYLWNNGSTNQTLSFLNVGSYTLIITDNNGCSGTATLNLTEPSSISLTAISKNDTCFQFKGGVSVTAAGGTGIYTYSWSSNQVSAVATSLSIGTYTVWVTDANGCKISKTVSVGNESTANANAGIDVSINKGETTQINGSSASTNSTFKWIPNTGLNKYDIANPLATPLETITYTLIVTDGNGCSATDTVIITVNFDCAKDDVFIPNSFSPNGDGINDMLYMRSNCVKSMLFTIYNRWGEKVFETTDLKNGWDGMFKGKALDNGVYVYYIEAALKNNERHINRGSITLIK